MSRQTGRRETKLTVVCAGGASAGGRKRVTLKREFFSSQVGALKKKPTASPRSPSCSRPRSLRVGAFTLAHPWLLIRMPGDDFQVGGRPSCHQPAPSLRCSAVRCSAVLPGNFGHSSLTRSLHANDVSRASRPLPPSPTLEPDQGVNMEKHLHSTYAPRILSSWLPVRAVCYAV